MSKESLKIDEAHALWRHVGAEEKPLVEMRLAKLLTAKIRSVIYGRLREQVPELENLILYKALTEDFQGASSFVTWLQEIIKNEIITFHRKGRDVDGRRLNDPPRFVSLEAARETQSNSDIEMTLLVKECYEQLSERHRDIYQRLLSGDETTRNERKILKVRLQRILYDK